MKKGGHGARNNAQAPPVTPDYPKLCEDYGAPVSVRSSAGLAGQPRLRVYW